MIYFNDCNYSKRGEGGGGGGRLWMIVMPNCLKCKKLPLNILLISNYLSTGHINSYCLAGYFYVLLLKSEYNYFSSFI